METRLVRPTFSISNWYGHIGISKISGPKMAGDMEGKRPIILCGFCLLLLTAWCACVSLSSFVYAPLIQSYGEMIEIYIYIKIYIYKKKILKWKPEVSIEYTQLLIMHWVPKGLRTLKRERLNDWLIDNIYTLSYYHHQIGSMNYYPLFRVRSWNNGVRFMSFYILI